MMPELANFLYTYDSRMGLRLLIQNILLMHRIFEFTMRRRACLPFSFFKRTANRMLIFIDCMHCISVILRGLWWAPLVIVEGENYGNAPIMCLVGVRWMEEKYYISFYYAYYSKLIIKYEKLPASSYIYPIKTPANWSIKQNTMCIHFVADFAQGMNISYFISIENRRTPERRDWYIVQNI